MTEEHREELPETSTETPVSEHETAVAAAVPLDELVLRILDEQAALAERLRGVADDQGRIRDALGILAHDVTVVANLLPSVAHLQTAILDQINAVDANLRGLGRVLADFVERMDA